jgi:pimeloyl-ACP methyl ester carboxylesterase
MPHRGTTFHHFGGDPSAPLLHIAHANGFPPTAYAPLAAPLIHAYRAVGLITRPLWSARIPRGFHTWHLLADDLIAGLETVAAEPIVGVGHSLGGVTTLLAAVKRPDLFRAVALLDPVLLPPLWLWFTRWMRRLPIPWRPPLVRRALRRRRTWPSSEAAYAYFREKPFFAGWPDPALRAYVKSGTRPATEGGVTLAYSPEWEAHLFESVPADVWRFVPRLSPALPALFVRGERSDTFRPGVQARVARQHPRARMAAVPGAGHMFPLQRPAETAALVHSFLSEAQSR